MLTHDKTIGEYFAKSFDNIGITSLFKMLGFLAITIDNMKNQKGKYCPVMVMGRHFEDHRVIQFVRYIESYIIKFNKKILL
jgi:Asp-tRNA(Asn)/Glu-tRNA(Gln) amidotransferase A subunit family amidase